MTLSDQDKIENINKYRTMFLKYSRFAEEIERILAESLTAKDIKYQSVQSRAKSVESFEAKSSRTKLDGALRYTDPLNEITDLTGVRVITFTLGDVQKVCNFLETEFTVQEKKDLGEERLDDGKFGYQSIHYICKLSERRTDLPEVARFKGLVCEIQVRTVLQHVWAQIEHGMQYKARTALPKAIKRKFTSLAGLLEIGDREFQAIEDDFDQLKDSVKLEFEDDLTKEAFNTSSSPSTSNGKIASKEKGIELLNVRSLIADERYIEAIESYNTKIADQPKNLTLYLGRAKAKFLSGDIAGAERDLQLAEDQQPGNKAVTALREKLIEGSYAHDSDVKDLSGANERTNLGHEALKSGDGELAYVHYSEAAEHGASRPFTVVNRAMACILAGDYSGARNLASSLQIRPGTPMEINILALTAIADRLNSHNNINIGVNHLTNIVKAKGDFSFALSPLSNLKIGLQSKMQKSKFDLVTDIFDILDS